MKSEHPIRNTFLPLTLVFTLVILPVPALASEPELENYEARADGSSATVSGEVGEDMADPGSSSSNDTPGGDGSA